MSIKKIESYAASLLAKGYHGNVESALRESSQHILDGHEPKLSDYNNYSLVSEEGEIVVYEEINSDKVRVQSYKW